MYRSQNMQITNEFLILTCSTWWVFGKFFEIFLGNVTCTDRLDARYFPRIHAMINVSGRTGLRKNKWEEKKTINRNRKEEWKKEENPKLDKHLQNVFIFVSFSQFHFVIHFVSVFFLLRLHFILIQCCGIGWFII